MMLPDSDCASSSDDHLAVSIADAITFSHWPSTNDANIIYYVRGAIARSVARSTKCDNCRQLLIAADVLKPTELDESLDYSDATFLDSVNRGVSLSQPSTLSCCRSTAGESLRTSEHQKC